MTRRDEKTLFLALAFITIMLKEKTTPSQDAEKVFRLAQLLGEFCDANVTHSLDEFAASYVDDKGAGEIDAAIERHIDALRKDHSTVLPDDRETLIKFYDRLQQRKSRRMQWQFYATAKADKLADLVLQYLDEEIEDREGLS